MKREEKKQQMRHRIMEQALKEFTEQGYECSSVNRICDPKLNISKGIIYHYFGSKEELYLACVDETFDHLRQYILAHFPGREENADLPDKLSRYFAVRTDFFRQRPLYRKIFCEAVMAPPKQLREKIDALREPLKQTNIVLMEEMLKGEALRVDFSPAELADWIVRLTGFFDAQTEADSSDIGAHERQDQLLLDVLFYGILARGDGKNG